MYNDRKHGYIARSAAEWSRRNYKPRNPSRGWNVFILTIVILAIVGLYLSGWLDPVIYLFFTSDFPGYGLQEDSPIVTILLAIAWIIS